MANELLDFVMSLVRDPEAAARFAANPDQMLADANLTNVTSADVSNLIPVVAESMSTAVPTAGLDGAEAASNVWASGAATAAFDAFDAELPMPGIDGAGAGGHGVGEVITDLIDQPGQTADAGLAALTDAGVPQLIDTVDAALDEPAFDSALDDLSDAASTVVEVADMDSDPSGFDIF